MMSKITNATLPFLLLLTTAVALLAPIATHSQNRISPRHPSVAYLQEWGFMVGSGLPCKPTWGEEFGRSIIPKQGNELLLYYGVKGGLPATSSGQRIGISEVGSRTYFLSVGDYDADNYFDIVCGVEHYADTTGGNKGGSQTGRAIIFWGNAEGKYRLSDTTQLPCDAPIWIAPSRGLTIDANADGIDDVMVMGTGSGLEQGTLRKIAKIYIYHGKNGSRLGQDGKAATADQRWWNPPPKNWVEWLDQDCDGVKDMVFHDKGSLVEKIHIAYGNPETGWIDTNDIQSIDTWQANGRFILFQDVTGDAVKDLVMIGG
ncbi:MAG: hypothetical protein DYG96_11030, partial [Chlorobi bacterium CHB2]|nr:hypothetical protein [Chlorobi bacterium CHB2]